MAEANQYTYIHTYIYTYTHPYIHTCMYSYIHTYIHTHIHTYIHILICFNIHVTPLCTRSSDVDVYVNAHACPSVDRGYLRNFSMILLKGTYPFCADTALTLMSVDFRSGDLR